MSGVSSTNRCSGGEALADAGSEPVHTDTGSVANVTALDPGQKVHNGSVLSFHILHAY